MPRIYQLLQCDFQHKYCANVRLSISSELLNCDVSVNYYVCDRKHGVEYCSLHQQIPQRYGDIYEFLSEGAPDPEGVQRRQQ